MYTFSEGGIYIKYNKVLSLYNILYDWFQNQILIGKHDIQLEKL